MRKHLLPLLFSLISSGVHAAIIYDESIEGDIDGVNETEIFTLVAGENTVSASSSLAFEWDDITGDISGGHDIDIFGFEIEEGNQLVSITFRYDVSSVVGELVSLGLRYQIALTGGDGKSDKSGAISATDEVVFIYSDGSNPRTITSPSPVDLVMYDIVGSETINIVTLPLDNGLYWLRDGRKSSFGGDVTANWDYSITFNVSSVPEPGTLALLGIGLFGLGLSRRRKV